MDTVDILELKEFNSNDPSGLYVEGYISKEIEGIRLTSGNIVKLIKWLDCTHE